MKAECIIEADDDVGDTHTLRFKFTYSDGSVMEIYFEEPGEEPRSEYVKMQEAILNNGTKCISYCNCNGEVEWTAGDGTVEFRVSKYGSGGDGSCSVEVPATCLIEIIQQILDHPGLNKEWESKLRV